MIQAGQGIFTLIGGANRDEAENSMSHSPQPQQGTKGSTPYSPSLSMETEWNVWTPIPTQEQHGKQHTCPLNQRVGGKSQEKRQLEKGVPKTWRGRSGQVKHEGDQNERTRRELN